MSRIEPGVVIPLSGVQRSLWRFASNQPFSAETAPIGFFATDLGMLLGPTLLRPKLTPGSIDEASGLTVVRSLVYAYEQSGASLDESWLYTSTDRRAGRKRTEWVRNITSNGTTDGRHATAAIDLFSPSPHSKGDPMLTLRYTREPDGGATVEKLGMHYSSLQDKAVADLSVTAVSDRWGEWRTLMAKAQYPRKRRVGVHVKVSMSKGKNNELSEEVEEVIGRSR